MHHCAPIRINRSAAETCDIFDEASADAELERSVRDIYQPLVEKIQWVTERNNTVKLSLAIDGYTLSALVRCAPAFVDKVKELSSSKSVEWLSVPYNNSLSIFYSDDAFKEEVARTRELLSSHFGVQSPVLLAAPAFEPGMVGLAPSMGFRGVVLNSELSNAYPVTFDRGEDLVVFATDPIISEAVTRRFGAGEAALTVNELIAMINRAPGDTVVLGFPLDIFKWHREASVQEFFQEFLTVAANNGQLFHPTDLIDRIRGNEATTLRQPPRLVSNSPCWLGNDLQRRAFMAAKELDEATGELVDSSSRHMLMQLLNARHFAHMSHSDEDLVSPYVSPQEAFIFYMDALNYLRTRISGEPVKEDDKAPRIVEAERQHPTTPAWALNEQSRYKENTHSHI